MKNIFILLIGLLIIINLISCGDNNPKQMESKRRMNTETLKSSVIYEVNLRQITEEGTFKAFEKHLPRLKELGVDILWLMPIHPIGEKNRKGTLGSYYSVKDYLAVNPSYGTMEDFKTLVDKIHEMDMFVIIDWVANHCAWDNGLVTEHPAWFTKNKKGKMVAPVDDWVDVVDFDYDNRELRKYMTSALKFWIEEANIDGYRCDVAEMVPFDFWKPAITELRKIKPIIMLAEAGSPECHTNGFDMTYGWDVYHAENDMIAGKKKLSDLRKLLQVENELLTKNVYRMNFTTNHDENSWNGTVFERLGDGAETFAVLSFVVPGMPLIYNGQEAGLDKRLDFFEKDMIEWKENDFTKLYKSLIDFYKNNKALTSENLENNFEIINTSNQKQILAILRAEQSQKVLAVFNLSPKNASFVIKDFRHKDNFVSVLPANNSEIFENKEMQLLPWEYRIYTN